MNDQALYTAIAIASLAVFAIGFALGAALGLGWT